MITYSAGTWKYQGGGIRMRGDIFWYILIQFSGYLIQILPLMFLFYVPCRQEMLRFSKKRILIALTVFFVISAAAASVFLGTQVWQGVNTAAVTWIANVFFLIDILAGTLIYYSSFRQKRGGKVLFYTFVLEYGIALYILNEIGTRFINISEDVMSPYGVSTLLIYIVCTGVTYPFIYSFLKKMDMKGIGQVDQKNLGMITVCSVIIVVLTVVALQMGVGLRSLNDSLEAKIYESVLVSCVLAANIIMYVIYFFCVALEHEREKMESRMIAYELQYENVREGIERKKRIQHNLRHHFRTLGALAAEGRNEEVQSYISSYMKDMDDFDLRKVSRNPVLDSVLSYYIQRAEEAKIKVNCDINVKEDYLFDIKDMTVLIGNAMENALKAAAGCRDDEAYINFMLKQYRRSILIKIENKVCPGRLVKRASNNKIEKSYGLASIEMIAEKYQGSVEAWQEEDLFTLRVVLNMPDDNRKGSDEG